MNILQLGLKAQICGYQHVSHQLRNRIQKLSGDSRHAVQLTKSQLGERTREFLLAYGLIRGIPYRKIEGHCAPGNEPDPRKLCEIIHKDLHSWHRRQDWPLERVKAWLDAGGESE